MAPVLTARSAAPNRSLGAGQASGAASGFGYGRPGTAVIAPGAEQLFAAVWDDHTDPFTNTVHVTISRLRRKLGEPLAIETITNVGYRIVDVTGTAGRTGG